MRSESLFALLFIVELFITLFGLFYIMTYNRDYDIIYCVKDFIVRLFSNRNTFGIILSCFLLIVLLPCLIILMILQLMLWLFSLGSFIWKLGMKENQTEDTKEHLK